MGGGTRAKHRRTTDRKCQYRDLGNRSVSERNICCDSVLGSPLTDYLSKILGALSTFVAHSFGLYDTQYTDRGGPDCRGRLKSAEDGSYAFRAVVPVSYPIPGDVSDY